jgi:hypothetical protein
MRAVWLLISFLVLTRPDGLKIWIAPGQVEYVTAAPSCDPRAHTFIQFGSGGSTCVREEPEDIVKRLVGAL